MKNILKSLVVIVAIAVVASQATLAAFTAQATVTGNTFSTGTAQLRLWSNLADEGSANFQTLDNTVDFNNIYPGWTTDYLAKVKNTGTVPLQLSLSEMPSVPEDLNPALAAAITAEIWLWTDVDGSGTTTLGDSYSLVSSQTIAAWQALAAAGVPLNTTLNALSTQGVLLRFTAGELPDGLQAAHMTYDFVFNGETPAVTP